MMAIEGMNPLSFSDCRGREIVFIRKCIVLHASSKGMG